MKKIYLLLSVAAAFHANAQIEEDRATLIPNSKKAETEKSSSGQCKAHGAHSDDFATDYKCEHTLSSQGAKLFQNLPNPFSQTTSVEYFIPEGIRNAALCIYSKEGLLLKTIPISDTGHGRVQVAAGEFRPGVYIYSLNLDGAAVAARRMFVN